MSMRVPRTGREWFLWLLPAMVTLVAVAIAEKVLPPIPPIVMSDGRQLGNVAGTLRRMMLITTSTLGVTSIWVTLILNRGSGRKVPDICSDIVLLMILNAFVAFGGCMLGAYVS